MSCYQEDIKAEESSWTLKTQNADCSDCLEEGSHQQDDNTNTVSRTQKYSHPYVNNISELQEDWEVCGP